MATSEVTATEEDVTSAEAPGEASPRANDVVTWTLIAGASLLVLLGATFVFAVIGFALGIDLGTWVIVPAVATQVAFTVVAWRTVGGQEVARRVVVVVAAIWLALMVLGFAEHSVRDTTTDGKHYHQASVVALADGWNPLRDKELPSDAANTYLKTNTYPKAPWILDAVVLKATNDIQAAKLPGAAFALAAVLVSISLFAEAGFRTKAAVGCALLVAANPIVLSELWTLMVDGTIASVLLCSLVFTLLLLWKRTNPRIALPALAAALVVLVNTKHTGALFVVVVIGATIALVGWRRHEGSDARRLLLFVAACSIVGVVALGANPYVTNFIRHDHNPLYPVIGPGTSDFTRQYKTGSLAGKSSPERLALAIVSQSAGTESNPHPKIPFTFTTKEWNVFRAPGLRSGGWGPLFSGALLLTIAAGGALLVRRKRSTIPGVALDLLIVSGCALFVTVVMPDSFVARFAPAMWLVPALAVPAFLLAKGDDLVRKLSVGAIVVLAINAGGIALNSSQLHISDGNRDASALRKLAHEKVGLAATFFGPYQDTDVYRLRHAGVKYVVSPNINCKSALVYSIDGTLRKRLPSQLPSTGVAFCNVDGSNLKL